MNYSFERPEEMQRLQQEAVRRVREMQARARNTLQKETPPPAETSGPAPETAAPEAAEAALREDDPAERASLPEKDRTAPRGGVFKKSPRAFSAPSGAKGGGISLIDALLSDSERTLILLVLLLLVDEKAETGLVLALMHLLM